MAEVPLGEGAQVLERAGWACESCEDATKELQVHHRYYDRGKKPWEYLDEALLCYCVVCHKRATDAQRLLREALRIIDPLALEHLAGVAAAMAMKGCEDPDISFRAMGYEFVSGFCNTWDGPISADGMIAALYETGTITREAIAMAEASEVGRARA